MQIIQELVLDENNVAFHPMMGNSYQLNTIAKEIISSIKSGETKESIVEKLSSKYDVNKKDLFIDVSDFFAKLKVYGLV